MPPRASGNPRMAIVGAGNLATALALSLQAAGYAIDEIIYRAGRSSRQKASRLGKKLGIPVASVQTAGLQAEIVWFCVPDREIANAAQSLAGGRNWQGKIALHSSGASSSRELEALRRRGAHAASVHPMMTFVRNSRRSLKGVAFALEGDARAARTARAIVKRLGGEAHRIRVADKPAYHAWGTFASPLFAALLAAGERIASKAGLDSKQARRRMLPILRQTLDNYAGLGPAGAFSGPIVRGDVDTVAQHLRILRKNPIEQQVYIALARAALAYLPAKNKKGIFAELEIAGARKSRRA